MNKDAKVYSEIEIEKKLTEGLFKGNTDEVIAQIQSLSKVEIAPKGIKLFNSFINTCGRINEYCENERYKFMNQLGLENTHQDQGTKSKKSKTKTFHTINIALTKRQVKEAIKIAKNEGYFSWMQLSDGALQTLIQTQNSFVLIKVDDFTTRLVMRWQNNKYHKSKFFKLFQPSLVDYQLLKLPKQLWFLYYPVKPIRFILSRLFSIKLQLPSPYLGTPTSLILPLLNFAKLTSQDYLVDFGCGDGRIVIEAIKTFGCKALGIEKDKSLYKQALENSKQFDLEDKLSIINTDFMDSSMTSATAIFLFLPVQLLQNFIPTIIKRLSKGTRIIAHEQQQIIADPKPNLSKLLISDSALTVAHLWIA